MPIPELIKFRQKYPQYEDMDDLDLAGRLASKYSEYSDLPDKVRLSTNNTGDKTIDALRFAQKEIVGPLAQSTNLSLAGIPKLALSQFKSPEEISEIFPEQQTNLGKVIRGASTVPALVLGVPFRAASAAGKGVSALASKGTGLVPQFAGKALAGRTLKSGVEGATGFVASDVDPSKLKENIQQGFVIGAAFPLAGASLKQVGNVSNQIGDYILNSTLGKTLADYGRTSGFDKIPKYFTEDIPRNIVIKLNDLFPKASKNAGEKISRLINSKYGDTTFDVDGLKDQVKKILPSGTTLDDLDISGADKKLLQGLTDKILKLGVRDEGLSQAQITKAFSELREISLPKLWSLRQELDRMSRARSITKPDAIDYISKLRSVMNTPIREAGKDIQKVFDRYSFIKGAEDEIGTAFFALKDKSAKNIYSKDIEKFINQITFGDGKKRTEVISMLKDVEKNLTSGDKVIDEVVNYAAAQELARPIKGAGGYIGSVLNFLLGGKKGIAEKASGIEKFKGQVGGTFKPLGIELERLYRNPSESAVFGRQLLRQGETPKRSLFQGNRGSTFQSDDEVKSLIEKSGGKFKGISKLEDTIYIDESGKPIEPTVYFDDAKGSTKTLPLSKINPENLKSKLGIPETSESLYHETSPSSASSMATSIADASGLNVSNDKVFALGQSGKGVIIEFDKNKLIKNYGSYGSYLKPITKPGTEFVGQKEFQVLGGTITPDKVKSIIIKPDVKLSKIERMRMYRYFPEKETLEDGTIILRPRNNINKNLNLPAGALTLGHIDMNKIYQIESSNDPKAYNQQSNARGLGQITPIVLKEWNDFHKDEVYKPNDLFNPATNRKISNWYMNKRIPQMLKYYKLPDTKKNRIISYNAGISYVKGKKQLPQETINYLEKYGVK